MRRTHGGHTLVGLLATFAIIGVLGVATFYGSGMLKSGAKSSPRADGKGTTVPGLVKASAQDTVCRSNLDQVRKGLQIAAIAGDDALPQTLQELRLGDSFTRCPLGNEPYAYDPQAGQVQCPHPGHEKY